MATPQIFTIPLVTGPQTLSVSLAGITYNMTVYWNYVMQSWILDIADVNDAPLVRGIPLVTGLDLLEQFSYIGIDGQLFVQTTNDPSAIPTFDNLGQESNLYFAVYS